MRTRGFFLFAGTTLGIAIALLIYSQTLAFAWDEGFHLLAARLIDTGKQPYLDFLFAQTPLNAWWNALLIRIFGESWRPVHAAAALETAAAVALTGGYIWMRFPEPRWRNGLAVATAVLLGFNQTVFEYGTIGQAYGLCLLLVVAAFWFSILDAGRALPWMAGLAGLASGAAAASSLLTAPVAPVLLLWIMWRNRTRRAFRLACFTAGAAIGCTPVLRPLFQSPRQVVFDVIGFHLYYRQTGWSDWLEHDLGVATAWLDSAPAFALIALASTGAGFIRKSGWGPEAKKELWLCAWMTLALVVFSLTAHPTFPSYFVFAAPFAAVLAAAGLYAMVRNAPASFRPVWPVAAVVALMAVSLARSVYGEREDRSWREFEEVAAQVDRVTPRGATLHADEHVYFLTHRLPPPGMEWGSGHKIEMPLDRAATLHVLPQSELDRRIGEGAFSTFETCEDSEVHRLGLTQIYRRKAEIGGCFVFWERLLPAAHRMN